ncbi:hypothetical protein SIN8267_00822 [Sinobacterium norvegicum]|uniref:Uncharacterized protein n=1 Tax=Sinobacterium norvegicum TaxID=1641715 RepID=A0ABN8EIP7_9GAMM|nr:hypothetical protein SIN8267_00822 [Sinobacterium norvegicum]
MKMQLTLNLSSDGSPNYATSPCGRYAWHCKRQIEVKAKSVKPSIASGSQTVR